ncbi:hypothetical protein PsorP6_011654 [Peronosclerospora sorghi]|uniref:Uncharacterized protein n=1 Tax=Peronosclerospora sorghi TaxID=230839 RepID=A0ACC0WIF5_9STRA|nr:hypothetical protein PsorP6_011654 [Peronosclerospora sorghi]
MITYKVHSVQDVVYLVVIDKVREAYARDSWLQDFIIGDNGIAKSSDILTVKTKKTSTKRTSTLTASTGLDPEQIVKQRTHKIVVKKTAATADEE